MFKRVKERGKREKETKCLLYSELKIFQAKKIKILQVKRKQFI